MPLKITLKNGEKIVINGAVIENVGGVAKALILNEASILREKDIITEKDATTPASRVYFAIQNLFLFPGNKDVALKAAETFLDDYVTAAPSAAEIVDSIREKLRDGATYKALKTVQELIEHERSVMRDTEEQLQEHISRHPAAGEPASD